jgi:hypothetical protein
VNLVSTDISFSSGLVVQLAFFLFLPHLSILPVAPSLNAYEHLTLDGTGHVVEC